MQVIAHRGYSGRYPENTMIAFKKALEARCDMIELDVHLTKDGIAVIIHDETLDRTTDGTGWVKDFSYKELQNVNASKLFPLRKQFESIPTLEEYFEWVQNKEVKTNIELKTNEYYYEGIEKTVLNLIEKYKLEKNVLISSFNHISISKIKEMASHIHCGVLVSGIGNAGGYCKQQGFEYYHPEYCTVSKESVEECNSYGIHTNVWVVDDLEGLENLYEWGCSGIITNYPKVAKDWINHMKSKGRQ